MKRLKKRIAIVVPENVKSKANDIIKDLRKDMDELEVVVHAECYDESPEEINLAAWSAINMFIEDDKRAKEIADELDISVDNAVSMIADLPAAYDLVEDLCLYAISG